MLTFHEDTALFREAIRYTAASTGFGARLIEKDYYCSVLLHALAVNTDLPWCSKVVPVLRKSMRDFTG
ncbi:hypothetical protein KQI65_18035 [bacterium]|nr:hypothetical protein [bacterium]